MSEHATSPRNKNCARDEIRKARSIKYIDSFQVEYMFALTELKRRNASEKLNTGKLPETEG